MSLHYLILGVLALAEIILFCIIKHQLNIQNSFQKASCTAYNKKYITKIVNKVLHDPFEYDGQMQ